MSAHIIVIGAGLGGLTAALALRHFGFSVALYEQAPTLGEVGAGLTLSRGGQSVFRALDVQDALAPHATPSTGFPFLHYQTGRLLAGELNHGAGLPDDGTVDIARQCHRADLHAVLAGAFAERALGALHLDHQLIAVEETAHGIRAVFANGETALGDALVAADGVRSAVRPLLWGEDSPRFTGQVAYRFLVGRDTALPYLGFGRGAVFLGPQRTFNRYTLRSGAILNCVGIAATDQWTGEGWATPATRDEMLAEFAGWHPDVTGLMAHSDQAIKWGLFDRAPLPLWSRGRATLLGDAAHAMLPFLGMGAAMAIEDAMILARAFAAEQAVEAGFARYETARHGRTELVHAKSVEQGQLTQARDPDTYDAAAAPASDRAILDYDPVTTPI
ncbi:FAD-dependent monooxygenase [Sphingomonas sp. AR_OL41]|uniref:FAD-dependent monooxygenase n=1 Tax=Sphingomonas sp. AR_OL41 TaxID=3042729 RepID=UPI00248085CF|nr:FAD-dependent monooxygenase [Sphingomonas sp. AR_OL41]MDH7973271.1 FAD-dependent monooxygenase [Sphingomonas sp. AR_OL41]